MTSCPNCGTQASGSFCPNCGTPLGANSGSAPPRPVGAPASSGAGLSNNVVAALGYAIPLLAILFLFIEPYRTDRFVRFHAFQSIFLSLAVLVISKLFGLIIALTFGLAVLLTPIYLILVLVLWVYMIVSAFQGKRVVLPLIGDLAAKQA